MFTSRFVGTLAIALMLAPTLSACGTTGGLTNSPEIGMSPQQLAQSKNQRDVILDTQMHFDDNGMALPQRPMSATEALMTAQIEQHCLKLANDRIRGQAGSMIKKVTLGSVLMGLGTFVGSLALPFMPFKTAERYGLYGAGSGAGSGAFTGSISIEQAHSIVNSYCQIMQVTNLRSVGDRRLKEIIVIPAVGLSGSRLPVDWKAITPTQTQKCLAEAGMNAAAVKQCRDDMPPDDVPPPVVP